MTPPFDGGVMENQSQEKLGSESSYLKLSDYIDETEKETEGGLGFVKKDDKDKLKVKISNDEVDKLIKEYKKLKRQQKSNLGQVKLLDQHGRQLEN